MSKHSIRAGDVAGLLARLAQLKEKARGRTGRDFPIIAIQEAGLDGFWIHRVLRPENAEAVLGAVEGDTLDETGEHFLGRWFKIGLHTDRRPFCLLALRL